MIFGYFFERITEVAGRFAPIICFAYPIVIGLIKKVMLKSIEPFGMDDIYEFASLAMAAFPYRFLFFGLDSILAMAIIMGVKFIYKWVGHFGKLVVKDLVERIKTK